MYSSVRNTWLTTDSIITTLHSERDDLIGFERAAICVKQHVSPAHNDLSLSKQLQHCRKDIMCRSSAGDPPFV